MLDIQTVGKKYGRHASQNNRLCDANARRPSENIREPAAELLGTMILTLIGTGVNCQLALSADPNVSPSPKGSYLGFNIAWGCGT